MQQFVLLELALRGERGGALCACVRSTNADAADAAAAADDVRYGRADGAAASLLRMGGGRRRRHRCGTTTATATVMMMVVVMVVVVLAQMVMVRTEVEVMLGML